jgi:NADPH2:quinone reductase
MRAAYYEKNGAARQVLTLGEVDTPRPGPGEVRIKLVTSGVNPSDVKARAGATRKIAFPRVIPHSDGAGEIDMVGDGVDRARIGERVWTWNGQWKRAFGTCAEYIVLPHAQAVHLPDHISFEAGACLGIPAMTAYHAIAVSGAAAGTTLLIPGGAGAVGHYAIQFAKARGAKVITSVSSDAKAKIARDAGADHVINYEHEDVGARVMEIVGEDGADAVIELDFAANAKLLPDVLRPRGTLVVYGTGVPQAELPAQFFLVNAIAIKFIFVYELTAEERAAALGEITRLLERNRLVHNVALALPLDDIVAAHEMVEQGKAMGNVVVRMPQEAAKTDAPAGEQMSGEGSPGLALTGGAGHA